MAMELEGKAVTIRRRDKSVRVKCDDCGKNIKKNGEMVVDEGRHLHFVCAGLISSPKVAPCPTCFIIAPCFCVGV